MSRRLQDKATQVIQIGIEDAFETISEEASEIIDSLRRSPASIPSKYFYDDRGTELLDAVSGSDGCNLSRIETEILNENLEEISSCIGPNATLVEPGIRSEEKTRTLLSGLNRVDRYIPIDVFRERLERFASDLRQDFPSIQITPVCADYSHQLPLGGDNFSERRIFFFSDSLLGNFEPARAEQMLRQFRFRAGLNSGLLLGIDLRRPADMLVKCYEDPSGLWAKFHLNALCHLNQRFQANIEVNDFQHRVRYDSVHDRVEMSLEAVRETSFLLAGEKFDFAPGREVVAQYSHKYELNSFDSSLRRCGWRLRQSWTDADKSFAVLWAEAWAI